MSKENNFWETKTLEQLDVDEWEQLCDGCGLCCLVKIEDEDSGEVFTTTVSCSQLDIENCRCKDYQNRLATVEMCTAISLENIAELHWLPASCAYRCLHEGGNLPDWHPLITGDKDSVHQSGLSAKWFALSEDYIHPEQLVDFVIVTDEK